MLTFLVTPSTPMLYYGVLTLIALYAAVVVFHLSCQPEGSMGRLLSHPALVQIGKRSYGIYLYHLPIFQLMEFFTDTGMNFVLATILKLTATGVVACLSYRYIEQPALRLKNLRYFSTAQPASAGDPSPDPRALSEAETTQQQKAA